MDEPAFLARPVAVVHQFDDWLVTRRQGHLANGLSDRVEVGLDRPPGIVHPFEPVGRSLVQRHGVHASSPFIAAESRPPQGHARTLILVAPDKTGQSLMNGWETVGDILARLRR